MSPNNDKEVDKEWEGRNGREGVLRHAYYTIDTIYAHISETVRLIVFSYANMYIYMTVHIHV